MATTPFSGCPPLLSFEVLHCFTGASLGPRHCLCVFGQSLGEAETIAASFGVDVSLSSQALHCGVWVCRSRAAEFPGEQSSVLKSSDSSGTSTESVPRAAFSCCISSFRELQLFYALCFLNLVFFFPLPYFFFFYFRE